MTTIETLFVGNDTLLELRDLTEETTGELVTGAAVEAVLKDASGDTTATVPMSEIEPGLYRGLIQHNTPLVPGGRYSVAVSVDGGPGRHALWTVPTVAKTRS